MRTLSILNEEYTDLLNYITLKVNKFKKTDWNEYTDEDKLFVENLVLLVSLLYNLCKVQLVKNDDNQNKIVNKEEINKSILLSETEFEKI